MTITLTWKRLTPDIWMSRGGAWLIRKTPRGVRLDNLLADEFDVWKGYSLESAKAEAQRLAEEEYNAILAGTPAMDFAEAPGR